MDLDAFLDFVAKNDELDLLKANPKTRAPTSEEHLVSKFQEVNEFVKNNAREPDADMSNVPEFMLHQRLVSIRQDKEQCDFLREYDTHSLLAEYPIENQQQIAAEARARYESEGEPEVVSKNIESIEEIMLSDELGLLSESPDSIFRIKNIPKERADTDFVARRKQCKNFDDFKDQFEQVQKDLSTGTRKLFKFKDNHLRAESYFVLDGVLLYLQSIEAEVKEEKYASGPRTRQDGRTYIVFENGTESNMLYRSLYKQLLRNGKSVSETNDESLAMFERNLSGITAEDKASGFIYILKSLSEDPEISSIENLYKIGYSTTSVEKRIANAEKQATYLMAPVEHVASYQCFNMSTQKFEDLIHAFLGAVCLQVTVIDGKGKPCSPQEWFMAPLSIIEQAIGLIVSGNVINFRYEPNTQTIVEIGN